jgi:hypothetical protein
MLNIYNITEHICNDILKNTFIYLCDSNSCAPLERGVGVLQIEILKLKK